jgi:hypothetical protein
MWFFDPTSGWCTLTSSLLVRVIDTLDNTKRRIAGFAMPWKLSRITLRISFPQALASLTTASHFLAKRSERKRLFAIGQQKRSGMNCMKLLNKFGLVWLF